MRSQIRLPLGLLGAMFALAGPCASPPAFASGDSTAATNVREPAVAGLFYPKDPTDLSKIIDACLGAAQAQPVGELKALVCPHAGYPYSGPVAAYAYKLLEGRQYDTVVVMGPSHYAELHGASVPDARLYRTPLGDVPISAKARTLALSKPFALEPPCLVQRPDWWLQSSRLAPVRETAETWEHSVEVEIPFLQRTLARFELVPVVCGDVDPARAARALAPILDGRTLIVASSDLSHYYSYDRARELDRGCVDAICRLDIEAMEDQQACGRTPILILMHIAKERGWKARLLDCRNSGDTAGDKSRVVGYAAIAFYEPFGERIGADERQSLLRIARGALREAVDTGRLHEIANPGPGLAEPRGCFVTLTDHGALRGCIGNLTARGPLYQVVAENARSAALSDPRFQPVSAREADGLKIEISVLSEPQRLFFSSPDDLLQKLQPGVDGVILRIGDRVATYLPQVWEQLPDKTAFLDSLAEKAGCGRSDWRKPGADVFLYEVEAFKE
ncbi:MAG TPA: AmmeMemoRadiSam system protein B, partial [Candidatus Sulfotelmatobacter sp.]|nr:AmmeMemoRadiSam system protein B [Candidatus Sulfotelmatobacter sp.]